MSSYRTMTFTVEDLTAELNTAKEALLKQLQKDGIIPDAKLLCETYAILVVEHKTLGTMWADVRKWVKDKCYFQIVKDDPVD